jgi:8-oxo-(d)GTP phosphatase
VTYIARVSLLVIRHADAGSRSAWRGDDFLRPLSEKGVKQALGIADALSPSHPDRIVSSPALRCTTTVEPLAEQAGVTLETDRRLFEDAGDAEIGDLLHDLGRGTIALCSHGDVIPHLLRSLVAEGMVPDGELRWAKASTWIIDRGERGWGRGTYLPPPGAPDR